MAYNEFAYFYDEFNGEADYDALYEQIRQELEDCNRKIEAITGTAPKFHRCPYGDYDNALLETVETMQMYCLQWDVDSLDWKGLSAEEITRRVVSQTASGSILLFHNDAQHTPEALPQIIEQLKAKGYRFLTASEMIYRDGYTLNHEGRQIADSAG